ncbi:sulfate/molybdate ABC transporter ATP-binding protein [Microbacterium sp. B2969]|uniref:Sulfate/molybdate ABC transporter ATP-binding protein n=1 Tax=Microbacterium alkaliflavum TaxID=3248839 RepID=A0ABW7Q2Z7_9MICO
MTGAALDARIVVARHGFELDAALSAQAGEAVAIMGPSGAGKSTLLGALAGLVAIHEGHVRLGERTLDAAPRPRTHVTPSERGVVLLGQDPRVFPHLSARDNVAFGPIARGVVRASAASAAEEWLHRVGLGGMGDRRPAQLSGGQQQRVAIARALATEPSALLLDEPFTSLDVETAGDIRAMLREQLTATGTTAVVATHDAVDAVSVADRLVVLEAGRVTQAGLVRDVLAAPASRFVASVSGLNRVLGRADGGWWRSGALVLAAPPEASAPAGSGAPAPAVTVAGGQAVAAGTSGAASAWGPAPPEPGSDSSAAGPAPPEPGTSGPSAAVFAPGAVRLERASDRDAASGVGEWIATVVRLEQTPGGVRVRTSDPDVAADLTADRAAGLAPGARVRLRVDPADVRFLRELWDRSHSTSRLP